MKRWANHLSRLARAPWGALRRHPCLSAVAGILLLTAAAGAGVNAWAAYQFRAAGRAVRDERYEEALRHVRLGLRVWPRSAEGHFLAARVERLSANYADAEHDLKECIRLQNEVSEATQLEWVLLRAQRGEVDDVAAGLRDRVNRGHPESGPILEAMARAYMHQVRFVPALVCLSRWLEREPGCARALDWRGWVWERLNRRQAAREDYCRALELEPGRSEVRLRLAELLLDGGKPDEVAGHFERLRRELPGRPEVFTGLARCRAAEGDFAEARRLLGAVLAAHPDDPAARLHRAKLALQEGRPAEAEADLRRALAADPYYLAARYSLWQCLQQQPGREHEAAEERVRHHALEADMERLAVVLNELVPQSPGNPDLAAEAGALLLRTGQEQLGLHWLGTALKLDARHERAHAALARYYESKGDSDQAEEHRRAAGARETPRSAAARVR